MRKRAETEGKEGWKKKKEQEDVGHHTLVIRIAHFMERRLCTLICAKFFAYLIK